MLIKRVLLTLVLCAVVFGLAQQTIVVDLGRLRTAPCAGASGDYFMAKGTQVFVDWDGVTPGDDAFSGLVLLTGNYVPNTARTCTIFRATAYAPAR